MPTGARKSEKGDDANERREFDESPKIVDQPVISKKRKEKTKQNTDKKRERKSTRLQCDEFELRCGRRIAS
jgi:hypothetical protein